VGAGLSDSLKFIGAVATVIQFASDCEEEQMSRIAVVPVNGLDDA
jgi:hypothetical protein